jgi:hypothetical protein
MNVATQGPWMGGINITAYADAEQRAYGWYHWYKNASDPAVKPYLALNYTLAGTATGLSKMPYLRDTRRSAMGIEGFRLFYEPLDNCTNPGPVPHAGRIEEDVVPAASCTTGYEFKDKIGIGVYFYADTHKMTAATCPYPSYFSVGSNVKPYFFPFRALTVAQVPNMLTAGKTLAETFWANSGTRLHPEEWTTGTAAGAAAVYMLANGYTVTDVYQNIHGLQLQLEHVGLPLNWTLSAR